MLRLIAAASSPLAPRPSPFASRFSKTLLGNPILSVVVNGLSTVGQCATPGAT